MKAIKFYFERVSDVLDLMKADQFVELINNEDIIVLYNTYINELTVKFKEPFDRYSLETVLSLVSFYANYN